jgi:antitoxin ChpS
MSENERWTVKCQETADGNGDVIVDLPPELLARLGLGLGDELTIEMVDGVIVLEPKHNTSSSS